MDHHACVKATPAEFLNHLRERAQPRSVVVPEKTVYGGVAEGNLPCVPPGKEAETGAGKSLSQRREKREREDKVAEAVRPDDKYARQFRLQAPTPANVEKIYRKYV
jgi:hypothetical protein